MRMTCYTNTRRLATTIPHLNWSESKPRSWPSDSEDDERNPAELGVLGREIKRVKRGRYILIPASTETTGHGTTGAAKWWKHDLAELLRGGA